MIPDTQFGVVYSINQEDSTGGNLTGVLDASAGASEFTFGPSVITDADGNQITVNPDGSGDATSVAGLTITDPATGAWSLDLGSDAMYSLLADQRLEIVGSYEYADGGNTVSNEYIIYVEKAANGDQKTTLLTGVDQGQELSLVQLQNLQFLAAENAYGSTEFTYVVSDGGLDDADNTNSIRETVNLDILGFNDTPVLPTDASGNVTITLTPATEDAEYTFTAAQLLNGVVDPDIFYNDNGTISDNPLGDELFVDNLSVTNGNVIDNDDGTYTFLGDQDFNGTAFVNYLIKDGQGGSISNTIELTVGSVNDAPEATYTATSDAFEDSSELTVQLTSFDVDEFAENGTTPEAATYSFVSAFIDDLDVVYGPTNNSQLSGSFRDITGGQLS